VTKSPIEKLPRIVDLLARILPDEARRLDRIVEHIGSDDRPADVPVHGDFYGAQILVRDSRPVGLIDVDTFGWGRPADDPAMMLGHLTLLAPTAENPAGVLDYARRLQTLWESIHEPADLRRRIAAVVLGQATGPFRVQRANWPAEVRQRIDTAEGWVKSSSRMRKVSSLAQVDLTFVPDH
jgi:aminoglycoside phosphotransferase (APT) family kinase protein